MEARPGSFSGRPTPSVQASLRARSLRPPRDGRCSTRQERRGQHRAARHGDRGQSPTSPLEHARRATLSWNQAPQLQRLLVPRQRLPSLLHRSSWQPHTKTRKMIASTVGSDPVRSLGAVSRLLQTAEWPSRALVTRSDRRPPAQWQLTCDRHCLCRSTGRTGVPQALSALIPDDGGGGFCLSGVALPDRAHPAVETLPNLRRRCVRASGPPAASINRPTIPPRLENVAHPKGLVANHGERQAS